jgi:hypothetical protein
MKTTMLAILTIALLTCFVTTGPVLAEPTGSSTIAGGNQPDPNKMPQDKRTDLTGGQQGVPDGGRSDGEAAAVEPLPGEG